LIGFKLLFKRHFEWTYTREVYVTSDVVMSIPLETNTNVLMYYYAFFIHHKGRKHMTETTL